MYLKCLCLINPTAAILIVVVLEMKHFHFRGIFTSPVILKIRLDSFQEIFVSINIDYCPFLLKY